MGKTRVYLYKSGYVKEDLTEIDPVFMQWFYSEKRAVQFANAHVSILQSQGVNTGLSDYHIIKCTKTIRGWVEIEGSEKHL